MKSFLKTAFRKVNSLRIYIFAYINKFNFLNNSEKKEKIIYIPFFGKIGDAVMLIDILRQIADIFAAERGYKLVISCRNEVKPILEKIDFKNEIEIFELTREKLFNDIKYFKAKVKEVESYNPKIIFHIRENESSENVFIHAIFSEEKIIFRILGKKYKSRLKRYYNESTYTKTIYADETKDLLSNYAELIRRMGNKKYKSHINKLPEFKEFCSDIGMKYVVISPGASIDGKCWPLERFSIVAEYILENTDYSIIFCGGNDEVNISRTIIKSLKSNENIYDYTAKTSIEEWFAIIQHAKLVISNESAATHISASCNTQNISIGEQTYGNKWLPYRPEYVGEEDKLPVILRGPRLSCNFCAKSKFFDDPVCRKYYEKYHTFKCVYDVTTEMVIKEINKYLNIKN